MSFEVAAVHATLGFRTQGSQEAIATSRQVEEAQRAIGRASESASAQVRLMGQELQTQVDAMTQFASGAEFANSVLAEQGHTLESVAKSLQGLRQETSTYTEAVAQAQAQVDATNQGLEQARQRADETRQAHGALGEEFKTAQERVSGLVTALGEEGEALRVAQNALRAHNRELSQLEGLQSVGESVAEGFEQARLPALAALEKNTKRLNREMGGLGKNLRINQTALTGFVSTLRTGNVPSALLAQGLQSITRAAGGAAAALAAFINPVTLVVAGLAALIALPIIIAFKGLNGELGKAVQAMSLLSPQVRQLTTDLDGLSKTTSLVELGGALELVQNRLASIGASNLDAVTEEIGNLANVAQFLRPGLNDGARAVQDIERAITSLSVESLRDYGIAVDQIEAAMSRLAEQGISKAAQRQELFNMLQAEFTRLSGEATAQAEREAGVFSSIGDAIGNFREQIAAMEVVQEVWQNFVAALKEALPLLKIIAVFIGQVIVGSIKVATAVIRTFMGVVRNIIDTLADLIEFASRIPIIGEAFEGAGQAVRKVSDWLEDAKLSSTSFENAIGDAATELGGMEDAADAAARRLSNFRDSVQGGFGIVSSIRGVADAFNAMGDDMNASTAFDAIESLDRAMGLLAEHGSEGLARLQEQLGTLARQGLISPAEFQSASAALKEVEDVAKPLLDSVRQVEERFGVTESAARGLADTNNASLTPSISAVGSMASSAAGMVDGLTNSLLSVPSQISTTISVNTIGGVGGIGLSLPGSATFSGALPPVSGGSGSSAGETEVRGRSGGFTPPPINEFNAAKAVNQSIIDNNKFKREVADVFKAFPKPGAGGGGGGGGGGGLASLDEIRQLFRNIGQLIKIGTNNGVFFSPAGNTIPLGGPNEFLNRQGGALVQTVNIRGIWDFADPSAKRQIIKELEEALAGLKREVN